MKKLNILSVKRVVLVLAVCFAVMASHTASAQISFPDDVDDETPAAPIDGFIGLGIAAGAYFGYRKLKGK